MRKILKITGWAFLFLVYFGIYLAAALNIPYNSDHASIILEAKAILEGNVLLKGWTLSTVSFYTTEMPFYVVSVFLLGVDERIIFLVTALNFALLSLVSVYLASVSADGRVSPGKLVVSGCLSMFLVAFYANVNQHSPGHAVGFTYCLISLIFLLKFQQSNRIVGLLGYFLLCTTAFTGDTFTIYTWGLPVGITMTYKLVTEKFRKEYVLLLAATVSAIVLSSVTMDLIQHNGGFRVPGVNTTFVAYPRIADNVFFVLAGLFDLFSVNLFGQQIFSLNTLLGSLRMVGVVLFIQTMVWGIKDFRRLALLNQILVVAICLNALEYLVGNQATERATIRYMMPSLIYSIALITNMVWEKYLAGYRYKYYVPLCLLISLALIPPLSLTKPEIPGAKLTSFLMDRHLTHGYSQFWLASSTTVRSKEMVNISPVLSRGTYVVPFHWLSDEKWYTNEANFVVVDNVKNIFNVNLTAAVNTFGVPDETYRVDDYTILVWNKNISPNLFRQDE